MITVFFRARKSSLCTEDFPPYERGKYVYCERSAPNFVIIKLKPRLFRFSLRTIPSFTGRWTLSHWALNDQSLGGERSVTGRWTMKRWSSVDGKMYIYGRQIQSSKPLLRKGLDNMTFRRAEYWQGFHQTHQWGSEGAHTKFHWFSL